ncbi:MAG: guanylate kinase [Ignavibacteriae bacterium]|nr:guanylate kinase [Ignavibacteriota bacterium]
MSRGKLIVLAAPSGSGKTTIAKKILQRYPAMTFSISVTTRPQRSGEMHGKDYFFLSVAEFEKKINSGELVEWERYPDAQHGNYYGTLKSEVDRALNAGTVMLFDVDVKGALSIKKIYGNDAVLIFIKPPNLEELRQRLLNRKTEDEEALRSRLNRVPMEMEMGKSFDFQIINDKLETAIAEIEDIITKHTNLEIIPK